MEMIYGYFTQIFEMHFGISKLRYMWCNKYKKGGNCLFLPNTALILSLAVKNKIK